MFKKEYNLGLIYNEDEQLMNELHKLLKLDRNYISQIGRQLCGLDMHAKKVLNLYEQLYTKSKKRDALQVDSGI